MHINEHSHRTPTIGLTPLIDVVFILLIFFMLATRFGTWQDLPMSVTATEQTEQVDSDDEGRHIEVLADGNVLVNDERLSLAELAQRLQNSPHRDTRVTASDDAPVQALLSVVDILQAAGLQDAALELIE